VIPNKKAFSSGEKSEEIKRRGKRIIAFIMAKSTRKMNLIMENNIFSMKGVLTVSFLLRLPIKIRGEVIIMRKAFKRKVITACVISPIMIKK